ncbi:hypothetical protein [Pseudoxanthomonas indica]|uniref:Uncharacterized protein n=1 Tax=Pseudoxanthomonas indica TaxID=428993 RepID=A0A1T5JDX9_9GAMM|nr:hypothetical protein [Pseudoxanthomonas indica]GGD58067.1 hypothetical protein GCM10007235_32940 [Pseudoxanthomonas indica]SKC49492.1 hypothetical protein SAMN06296058_0717 [Pseudoxanthomonas indica]
MTVTISLPMALFFFGLLALFLGGWWAERQGGGMLSGCFEAAIGVCACLLCWAIAAGILIGRWLA